MYDICIYFCLQRYVDIRIVFLLLRPAARCCCVVLMLSPSVSFCRCGFCSVCFVSDCWARQTTRPAGRFASVFFCFDPFPTVVLLVELCVVLCCFGLCCVVVRCVYCGTVRSVLFNRPSFANKSNNTVFVLFQRKFCERGTFAKHNFAKHSFAKQNTKHAVEPARNDC